MKRKLLLLLCSVLTCVGQMMAIVLPSGWTWTGEEPTAGKIYYIYNTNKNKFWYSNPNKIQTSPDRYYGITDDFTTATPIIFSGGGDNSALKYYIGEDYYYLHQKDGNPTMTKNGSEQTMRVNGSSSGYAIRNDKSGSSYRYMSYDDSNPGTCHFPKDNNYYYWIFISQEQMARYCALVAEINFVQFSAGWNKITELPTNPEDYYYAFISADVPGIMVNMQNPEGRHNTQGKALYYAEANETNSGQNRGYLWTIKDCGDNVQAFTNVEDGHYVQTHDWSWSWHIYANDLTETNNLTQMGFRYNTSSGSWTIENLNYSGNYLGSWDRLRPANGGEFCGNITKNSNSEPYIANLLIYAVNKDVNVLPNNSNSGWTDGVECNTWSVEGNDDGTGFVTPFNQVWREKPTSLDNGTYFHSFTPTRTGQYKISAWTRLYNQSSGQTTYSGATLWAGSESNSVSLCENGTLYNDNKVYLGEYSVRYNATAGEAFNLGFKLAGANFNWFAFKNVTITYLGETLSDGATEFTSGSAASRDTWYAFNVPENASYMLTSTAAATLSYSQDGGRCVNDDDFSTLALIEGMSKCLILDAGTYYFKSNANTTLTITVPEDGEDVTNLIENPSFESGNMTGWKADRDANTGVELNSNETFKISYGDPVDGDYIFNTWGETSENNVYQTINNMPAGTYHLSALLAGFKNETLTLSANTFNNSIVVPDNGDNSKKYGYTTSLYFTLNAAANVQIKAANTKGQSTSDASFIKADNFRLTYYENDQVQTISEAFTSGNATTSGAWKAVTVTAGNYMLTSTASTTLSYSQDGEKSFSANDFSTLTLAAGVSKCLTLTAGTLYFKSSAAATLTLTPFAKDLDMTSCITNSDFESDLEGWTNDNFEIQSGNSNYSGKFAEMWTASGDLSSGDLNQTLNSLPTGIYRLTAKSWADITCNLYASISGNKQEISYQTAEAVDRNLTFAVATTSNVVIGIYHEGKTSVSGSTWVSCDDFRLTYLGDASANLKVNDGKLGTFIAPFAITLPTGVKAYSATSDAEKVILAKIAEGGETLAAGTPVIIYGDGVSVNETFYGDATETENVTVNALTGILDNSNKTVPANSYVLQTQDDTQSFYKLASAATGALNRCYVTASSGVTAARLAISIDEETAINAIEATETEAGVLKDGKFLIGGRIVVVKNGVKYSVNGQKLN